MDPGKAAWGSRYPPRLLLVNVHVTSALLLMDSMKNSNFGVGCWSSKRWVTKWPFSSQQIGSAVSWRASGPPAFGAPEMFSFFQVFFPLFLIWCCGRWWVSPSCPRVLKTHREESKNSGVWILSRWEDVSQSHGGFIWLYLHCVLTTNTLLWSLLMTNGFQEPQKMAVVEVN